MLIGDVSIRSLSKTKVSLGRGYGGPELKERATAKVLLVGKYSYIEARRVVSSVFFFFRSDCDQRERAFPFVTWTQQLLQVSSLLFKSAQTNIALLFFY